MLQPQATQKVTAHIPIDLLEDAQAVTGKGITETIKIALGHLALTDIYQDLRKLRGKVNFTIDVNQLREGDEA
jgi:hypothetical protein